MELIKRILFESLTGTNNKFSSKKLTMFEYAQLGVFMVLVDMITNHGKLNEYAFPIVVGMAIGVSVLATADNKINNNKNETDKE